MYVVLFVLIANAPAYCLHTKLLLWGMLSASIAQRLEHWSCKPGVESSNLSGGFLFFLLQRCQNFLFFFCRQNFEWFTAAIRLQHTRIKFCGRHGEQSKGGTSSNKATWSKIKSYFLLILIIFQSSLQTATTSSSTPSTSGATPQPSSSETAATTSTPPKYVHTYYCLYAVRNMLLIHMLPFWIAKYKQLVYSDRQGLVCPLGFYSYIHLTLFSFNSNFLLHLHVHFSIQL